jgi:hypothetical protein
MAFNWGVFWQLSNPIINRAANEDWFQHAGADLSITCGHRQLFPPLAGHEQVIGYYFKPFASFGALCDGPVKGKRAGSAWISLSGLSFTIAFLMVKPSVRAACAGVATSPASTSVATIIALNALFIILASSSMLWL